MRLERGNILLALSLCCEEVALAGLGRVVSGLACSAAVWFQLWIFSFGGVENHREKL